MTEFQAGLGIERGARSPRDRKALYKRGESSQKYRSRTHFARRHRDRRLVRFVHVEFGGTVSWQRAEDIEPFLVHIS